MSDQSNDQLLGVLKDIRTWVRAAAYKPVKAQLEAALPDEKSRLAYQMLDGSTSIDQVRTKCQMSPNAVVALTSRCVSMGLMTANSDKRRVRLFDLTDFGLLLADATRDSKTR
jgi:hypothetical protein